MRQYGHLLFDVFCITLMLVVALYLRNGIPLIEDGHPDDLKILLGLTTGVSLLILPLLNTHKRLWRYTSSSDLGAVMIAVTLAVLLPNGGFFLFNRLEVMPRSVPPMHWALSVFVLCGARLLTRRFYHATSVQDARMQRRQHVLLLGAGHVAELYLAFTKRIIPGQVVVEGLIDENPDLMHRSFHQHAIMGTPEMLESIIERFMVHGIRISQIVLAQPLESLTPKSRQYLLDLKHQHNIALVHFQKQIGISEEMLSLEASLPDSRDFNPETAYTPSGFYPRFKRALDVLGALALMVLLAPIMLLTALVVWLDVGMPLFFWQQRPGFRGNPFRLYKFRTMRPARRKLNEDRLAHKTGDLRRTSVAGYWIRRLRLDELPQLFHILSGRMSFIGPRPLLPEDQPEGGAARLSIRPGITGWAQVHGGDALNAEQKLILDLWYIQNMSLWLDMIILFKTLRVAVTGDKPSLERIDLYRQALREPLNLHSASHREAKHA